MRNVMTSMQIRDAVLTQLKKFKNDGYRVYVNNTNTDREGFSSFGLITDGKSVVYIQPDEPSLNWPSLGPKFMMCYSYTPTRDFGSGVAYITEYHGHEELTDEDFHECVKYGESYAEINKIPMYRDLNDYLHKQVFKDLYVEI